MLGILNALGLVEDSHIYTTPKFNCTAHPTPEFVLSKHARLNLHEIVPHFLVVQSSVSVRHSFFFLSLSPFRNWLKCRVQVVPVLTYGEDGLELILPISILAL